VRIARISGVIVRRSLPASSGAASIDQRVMCVTCSSGVRFVLWRLGPQPTLPTTSMSGSFQWPGPANFSCPFCRKPIFAILDQRSTMSPVVRHRLPPTPGPHFHTSARPYWQRL